MENNIRLNAIDGREYLIGQFTEIACESKSQDISELTEYEQKQYNIGDPFGNEEGKIVCAVGRAFIINEAGTPVTVIRFADVDRHFGWTAGMNLFDVYDDAATGRKIFRYELSKEDVRWTRA